MTMSMARSHLLAKPWLAVLLLAVALMARAMVPTGFMPVVAGGSIALELCPGTQPAVAGPMHGRMHHDHHGGKGEMPCPFGALTLAAGAGAGPVLAQAAPPFILPAGVTISATPPARAVSRLRPPPRAPPFPVSLNA
jgi:hypothetical protein